MRIAFVGKGGAGKSTVTTLFFLYLIKHGKCALCVDADLNIHVPQLLGIDFPEAKAISLHENAGEIRKHLIGESKHIKGPEYFYKTTPPSRGVRLFRLMQTDPLIQSYTEPYGQGYVAVVGTYQDNEIGRVCYHENLAVFENLLSFAKLAKDEWIIADMVAGIDAFSNTLHKQFDLLCLVTEPTHESVAVYEQYQKLASRAGMADRLFVLGNKVEDEGDEEYLKKAIPTKQYLGHLRKNVEVKKMRQEAKAFSEIALSLIDTTVLAKIASLTEGLRKDSNERLRDLHELHRAYIDQDYVKNAVGDISSQIDEEFRF